MNAPQLFAQPKASLQKPHAAFLLLVGLLLGFVACTGGGGSDVNTPSTPAPIPTATPTPVQKVYGAEFTVSPSGSDSNPGTPDKPIQSLEKVRDAVRALIAKGVPRGGIAVWLKGGIYERTAALDLGAQDSGSSETDTVDWRAVPGETVRLIGGRKLDAALFAPVTSASPIWNRLDASAQGKVIQIDLKAQGITDYGTLTQRGFASSTGSAMELFIESEPMTLARWPDRDESNLLQDISGDSFELFGNTTPDISGTYTKVGVEDGVSLFKRDASVGGVTYYLRRRTWAYQGNMNRAWYITTNTTGAPNAANVYWSFNPNSGTDPGIFKPDSSHPSAGTPTAFNPARINHGYFHTAAPVSDASFSYEGDRPARWTQAKDAWVDGYWSETWAQFHLPIATIDVGNRNITLVNKPASYGMKADRPWYAYNLLEEITQPGEWYVDRTTGILYLWPPSGFGASSDVVVSLTDKPLFALNKTTNISFRDLTLEATRTGLINITAGKNVTLANLVLRNSGSHSASVSGESCLISRCTFSGAGNTAIRLIGGDRKSLMPGAIRMEDCDVSHFARFVRSGQTGVDIEGCGNILRNNHIHDTAQSAIDFKGNDHLIELNDVHDVCLITTDASALYSGRDWGARGNIVRNNFIHRLHSIFNADLNGVYLDDCASGIRVEGNLIYDIAGAGIKAGGGRDSLLVNNLLIQCGYGLYADSRALEWQSKGFPSNIPGDSWNLLEKLKNLGYQQEPWASRFPECAAIPNDWNTILAQPHWLHPEGTIFSGNVGWKNFRWSYATTDTLSRFKDISHNIEDQDPLFVDEAGGDLTLKSASPVLAIPGFQAIPFKQIGIRK